MNAAIKVFLLIAFIGHAVYGQTSNVFVSNEGQWTDDFDYKLEIGSGAVFLHEEGITVSILEEGVLENWHRAMHGEELKPIDSIQGHAYEVKLVGATRNRRPIPRQQSETLYNYFLGSNEDRWRSGVRAYADITYPEVYKGIDVRYYFSKEGNLKYDFIIASNANPNKIAMQYQGVDSLGLVDGNLVIHTTVKDITEIKPYAYQALGGKLVEVECAFQLEENVVKFEVGNYDRHYPLIIDPELVFSTFTGSSANNFGFTATYSEKGGLYAGGVVFNDGGAYPVTLGAFQVNFLGPRIDIAISKFSGSGRHMLYSTIIGGGEDEMPYSLVETTDGKLVIYGSTGSTNFPVRRDAFDPTFNGGNGPLNFFQNEVTYPNGADVFICVLNELGGGLPASTYYGGAGNDGFNGLDYNYGDQFRGEVVVDSIGNIYIAGSSQSTDLSTSPNSFLHAAPSGTNGFVASFTPNLDSLRWGSYVGGPKADNALSVKVNPDQQSVFVAGGSSSEYMSLVSGAYKEVNTGGVDGYILKLDANDGAFLGGTYNGSVGRDVNYFLDVDPLGDVYVFGQTRGNYPVSVDSSLFQVLGSAQYVHKFSGDLKSSRKAMVFGDGRHARCNISPTAFMVDECMNIYVSGWGGAINRGANHNQGWTRNMPITSDAFQSSTDGSDFYFMVLDASWKELLYATYFGDKGADHVDGGTSRFSPDGTIYQAVCAGCFGNSLWPTTPNAYSRYNNTWYGCNLAAVKMEFDFLEVKALPVADIDTACIPFSVKVTNESRNADTYQWIDPSGNLIGGSLDSLYLDQRGTYEYKLVAIDTMCNKRDTGMMVIYAFGDSVFADFTMNFDSCSNILKVDFTNNSINGVTYLWDFGDGQKSTQVSPTHYYVYDGTFDITLILNNYVCGVSDTVARSISLKKRVNSEEIRTSYEPCRDGRSVSMKVLGTDFQEYKWQFENGDELYGEEVVYSFGEGGLHHLTISLKDTICNRFVTIDTVLEVFHNDYFPRMPNVFTPNGDGVNDYFGIPEGANPEFFSKVYMKVFNRWGRLLFQTENIDAPWDGTFEGNKLSEGVYFYVLNVEDNCGNHKELKGFVHLMNH